MNPSRIEKMGYSDLHRFKLHHAGRMQGFGCEGLALKLVIGDWCAERRHSSGIRRAPLRPRRQVRTTQSHGIRHSHSHTAHVTVTQ